MKNFFRRVMACLAVTLTTAMLVAPLAAQAQDATKAPAPAASAPAAASAASASEAPAPAASTAVAPAAEPAASGLDANSLSKGLSGLK